MELDQPRRMHHDYAHKVLPSMLQGDPARFSKALLASKGELLRKAWDGHNATLPEYQQLSSKGLSVSISGGKKGAPTVVIVQLPKAKAPTEAHMVGIILETLPEPTGVRGRYVTLEADVDDRGKDITVLGSWDDQGHRDLGAGPANDKRAFELMLQAIVRGEGPKIHALTRGPSVG